MIQLLDSIQYLDWRRIPIARSSHPTLVEVASDRRIDMAIVTPQQYREFQNANDSQSFSFDWVEGLRSHDFFIEPDEDSNLSLLIWNSNEVEPAFVVYKMTEVLSKQLV